MTTTPIWVSVAIAVAAFMAAGALFVAAGGTRYGCWAWGRERADCMMWGFVCGCVGVVSLVASALFGVVWVIIDRYR